AGEGLSLDAGESAVKRIASDATVFMLDPSEQESELVISDRYVSTIKAAKPVAYWRFEQATGNAFVNNEMPDMVPLRICGDARLEVSQGNGRIGFPQTDREGWLKTDEAVKAFAGDYALEMWMKIRSYHNGAVISLKPWRASIQTVEVAGLVEL